MRDRRRWVFLRARESERAPVDERERVWRRRALLHLPEGQAEEEPDKQSPTPHTRALRNFLQ